MAEYFKKDGDNYVPVDDKLLGQEDVEKVVESRLERERKKFSDYDTLKETAGKVNSIKSEYEDKLKEKDTKLSETEKLVGAAKLETVKVKAIHEFKLSDELSEFLNGDDEDTIRSQAEKLSKGVPGGGVKIDKTPKPGDKKTSDTKTVAQNLFGKKSDD
jgi:hypothetical protein